MSKHTDSSSIDNIVVACLAIVGCAPGYAFICTNVMGSAKGLTTLMHILYMCHLLYLLNCVSPVRESHGKGNSGKEGRSYYVTSS